MAPTTDHQAAKAEAEAEGSDVDMDLEEEEDDDGFIKFYDSGDGAFDSSHPSCMHCVCFATTTDRLAARLRITHPPFPRVHKNAEEGNPPGGEEEGAQGQQGQGAPDGMIRPYFEVPWYRTHHLQQQSVRACLYGCMYVARSLAPEEGVLKRLTASIQSIHP